ncbi:hypothetical protein GCM10010297_57220 [Streptomyces malachitofuscus]|nr:hypothetical protein GCM10010297_57220 [Streptomyces malachitofuscus]
MTYMLVPDPWPGFIRCGGPPPPYGGGPHRPEEDPTELPDETDRSHRAPEPPAGGKPGRGLRHAGGVPQTFTPKSWAMPTRPEA